MSLHKHLHQLMAKEVDRKEFLLYLGAMVVAATGVTQVVKNVVNPKANTTSSTEPTNSYGANVYGGKRPTSKPGRRV